MSLILPGIATQSITVYRAATGSYVGGRWVDGSEGPFTIQGSHQPANGEERRNLPEGVRSDDIRKIYTDARLQEADETEGQTADEIELDGTRYRVIKVYSYPFGSSFGYNKVMVERV
jgi:hypothetical protein